MEDEQRPSEPPGPKTARDGFRELRRLLDRFGVTPRRSRGQNFLHDPSLLRWIADTARPAPDDVVLEVGGGCGFLTRELARRAGHVVVAEIDDRLFACLEHRFASAGNVTLLRADALAGKRALAPAVLDALERIRGQRPVRCVSNLPYAIAVPFLIAWLESGLPVGPSVLMVQREVAERLAAEPGTRSYGPATVSVRRLADVRLLRTVPREVFYPRPRIESTIVAIDPLPRPRVEVPDRARLEAVLAALFQHRRKRVLNALRAGSFATIGAERLADRIREAGIPAERRADQLDLEEIGRLARCLAEESTGG